MDLWSPLFHTGTENPDCPVHSLVSALAKLSWLLCIFVESFTSFVGPVAQSVQQLATAGHSGVRNPVGSRFSSPVQTGLGAHTASCTMDTGSFPGVKSGRGVTLTPHPLLVPWSIKG